MTPTIRDIPNNNAAALSGSAAFLSSSRLVGLDYALLAKASRCAAI